MSVYNLLKRCGMENGPQPCSTCVPLFMQVADFLQQEEAPKKNTSKYMNLLIKPTNDCTEIVKEYYTKHGTFHAGDAGLDLFCLEDLIVPARAYGIKMPLGVCMAAYDSETRKGNAFYLYPRSSTGSRTPIRLSNSVGVIDPSYRGPLTAILDNLSDKDYMMRKGERYFQVCAPDLRPICFKLVNKLDETTRGEGGFGSTGK